MRTWTVWRIGVAVAALAMVGLSASAQERPGGGGGIRPTNSPSSVGDVIVAVTTTPPIVTKWSSSTNLQASATNAQPPSTTLTNLSATGAFTNANPNQFSAPFTPFLTITNGAKLTNEQDFVNFQVFGNAQISTNLNVTNNLTVGGNVLSATITNNGAFTNSGSFYEGSSLFLGGTLFANTDVNVTGNITVNGSINNTALTTSLNSKMNGATNANQFGPSTTLTIKDGSFFTNSANYGNTTNKGTTYTEGLIVASGMTSSGQITANANVVLTGFSDGIIGTVAGVVTRVSGVDNTEAGYLDGVTSPIQTQLNNKIANNNGIGTNTDFYGTIDFYGGSFRVAGFSYFTNQISALGGIDTAGIDVGAGGIDNSSISVLRDTVYVAGFGNIFYQDLTVDGLFTANGDALFNTSLMIPRASSPDTALFGKIAAKQDAYATGRGVLQTTDGTDNTFLVAITNVPTDGQSPVFNGTLKTWSAQTPAAGGGGGIAQTNGNQFGATTVLTIKNGALVTNLNARGITMPNVTVSRAAAFNSNGDLTNSATTDTELGFVSGVTSALQTQLNGKQNGQTNSSQFGASTTITLRDGVTVTNANLSGTTSLTNPPGSGSPKLRLYQTNGNSYTEFTLPAGWTPTNSLVLWLTNASVGKVLQVNSVSIAGGVATINITNDYASGLFTTFSSSRFSSNTVAGALIELANANGSGPNASDGKVSWSQIINMPAGFADGVDAGSTNALVMAPGTLYVTNSVQYQWVHLGNTTNVVLDWGVTNHYISSPSNAFTVSFANQPAAGSPWQQVFLELRNTNSTSAYFTTNGLNNSPVILLSAPSTNTYTFNFDGTNTWTSSDQILTTGSGDTNVFNINPTLFSASNMIQTIHVPASGSVTVVKPATATVSVTNVIGLVHKLSTSPVELDANASARFTITNRVTANTTLVFTNTSDGQEITATILGEASVNNRTITLIPQLGHLVADLDTFGTALATSSSFVLTNGNAAEISWKVSRINGTNIAAKVTRQFAF
jgi:hypothetical protein